MIIYLIVVEDNSGDRVTMLTLYGFAVAYRIMPAIQLVFANATQIKFNFSALNELA